MSISASLNWSEPQPRFAANSAACGPFTILFDGYAHDARFVAEQWARSGAAALPLLDGDWALIVWDANTRALTLARSAFGFRPLYFHAGVREFACASEICELLALPGVAREIAEAIAAEYLTGMLRSRTGTLYRDIQKVEPGCFVEASASGTTEQRFWDLQAGEATRLKLDDATSRLRELVLSAVRARLASNAAVELSGGIDSSVIASQAALVAQNVSAYSLVYPGLDCDESPFIASVAKQARLRSHCFSAVRATPGDWAQQVRDTGLPPLTPNVSASSALRQAAAHHRVLLTGQGGDEFFTGSAAHYSDRARSLRFGSLARMAAQDRVAAGTWRSFARTLRLGFSPMVPRGLKRAAPSYPAWLNQDFVRRTSLVDRIEQSASCGNHLTSFVQREIYGAVHSGHALHLREENQRAASAADLEYRHPFFDSAVAQFGFDLPDDVRRSGLLTKLVLRKAFASDLPASVLARTTKAEFRHLFLNAFEDFGELRKDAQVVQRGWVDRARFNEAIRDKAAVPIWPAWGVVAIETWLQNLGSRGTSSPGLH